VTALPHAPRLLTAAEYLALGEPASGYEELVEGRIVVSPSASREHNHAALMLGMQLHPQLPEDLQILLDTDVDLQLTPPAAPGFVRRPDVLVFRRGADRITAADVLLAVEVVSPGSVRTDHVVKRGEYADAGIPHHWIIDPAPPVTLVACHLGASFGHLDGGAATGGFTTTDPFPLRIDLDALR
jgi:Uma2 family endonuclease